MEEIKKINELEMKEIESLIEAIKDKNNIESNMTLLRKLGMNFGLRLEESLAICKLVNPKFKGPEKAISKENRKKELAKFLCKNYNITAEFARGIANEINDELIEIERRKARNSFKTFMKQHRNNIKGFTKEDVENYIEVMSNYEQE